MDKRCLFGYYPEAVNETGKIQYQIYDVICKLKCYIILQCQMHQRVWFCFIFSHDYDIH